MAFNREDLITWNELAPSLQSIFAALQNQITALTRKITLLRIVDKILHFEHIFEQHQDSEHPHNKDVLAILRRPSTKYAKGDRVYDVNLPINCVLECTKAGKTAADVFIETGYDCFVSDAACETYSVLSTLNNKIKALHNSLQKHILDSGSHEFYSNFLTRQHATSYVVGDQVFNDTNHDITTVLEVTVKGKTSSKSEITLPAAFVATDLQSADEELERLNNELNSHITSNNPHDYLHFLTRQKSTAYQVGDKVFAPGLPAQYYLECVSVTGEGKTSSSDLKITIS